VKEPILKEKIKKVGLARSKPDWLKVKLPSGSKYLEIKEKSKKNQLFTVCEEARCPNIGECWSGGTATYMIMGGTCTRGCKFCSVKTGNPKGWLDLEEPQKIAESVKSLSLKYIVLTSVDRDDLPDHGASHFARTVAYTKMLSPGILVETLTPDWQGEEKSIQIMVDSQADVLAHNIETVESLQKKVRDPRAGYALSLEVLKKYRKYREKEGRSILTKSSLMLGLGETDAEIEKCMLDLLSVGVSILTIGQYLKPSSNKLDVVEYVEPEKFAYWAKRGEELGFTYVASGPLVRSSYRAAEYYIEKILLGQKSNGQIMVPGGHS